MNCTQEPIITNLADYITAINKIADPDSNHFYIYRGQTDADWPVACSAARRLKHSSDSIEDQIINYLLIGYLEYLIAKARMRGFLPTGFNESSTDLELLAHLQHQGAATGLIDFTRQPLVALWFACNGPSDKNGAVFLLNPSQTEEISNRAQLKGRTIKSYYDENKLWLWEPSALGNRIVAQGSVFVFGAPVIPPSKMKSLIIQADSKNAILKKLETVYGINEEGLFSDFSGYAVANQSTKAFDNERAIRYWQERIMAVSSDEEEAEDYFNCGTAFHAAKNFRQALKYYGKAIEYDPEFIAAYNNRGLAKSNLGQYEAAIVDFDEALRLTPQDAEFYNNRGLAKSNLEQYEAAIVDFDTAIGLTPQDAEFYNSRGLAKSNLEQYEAAIVDFDTAIGLTPQDAEFYNSRGLAKSSLGQYEAAIVDFDTAIGLNPRFAEASHGRGLTKVDLGKHEGARADFQRALELATEQGNEWLMKLAQEQLNKLPPGN